MDNKTEIVDLLKSKYKNHEDFTLIENNVYSKTSISFQTLIELNNLHPVKAIYYLSVDCRPYKLGYKIGVVFSV